MSLTGQLKDADSPVSRFFAEHLKSERGFNQIINYHNDLLAAQEPFVIDGADPSLSL